MDVNGEYDGAAYARQELDEAAIDAATDHEMFGLRNMVHLKTLLFEYFIDHVYYDFK